MYMLYLNTCLHQPSLQYGTHIVADREQYRTVRFLLLCGRSADERATALSLPLDSGTVRVFTN